MAVLEANGTKTGAYTVQSTGATIEVRRFGSDSGPSMLACACDVEIVRKLGSPVFSMRLRGYGDSKVG